MPIWQRLEMIATLVVVSMGSDTWLPERDAVKTSARLQTLAAAPAFDRLAFEDAVEASRKQASLLGSPLQLRLHHAQLDLYRWQYIIFNLLTWPSDITECMLYRVQRDWKQAAFATKKKNNLHLASSHR